MKWFRHGLELAGLGGIGWGCYLVYAPLAWIYAGAAALLLAACWYLSDLNNGGGNGR